ncbi:hypothetical protein GQX73_g2008 [Xylaria multiplex]|uniref:AA1-like domain-containing protein n=1 Tax=Xylaria multiplex TaxID=323545 RepID=A0A7C8N9D0_9PEZI|nr:hypothetical protein GQX73_g2008 [Xylaria multiplex]
MRTSILSAIAALAASAIATPIEARDVYAKWSATDVTTYVSHIIIGAKFRISAPAGYVTGAPAFDVTCDVDLVIRRGIQACTFNGEQAEGSKVEAIYSPEPPITVYHTFGSTKATGTSGSLSYNADFALDVTEVGSA